MSPTMKLFAAACAIVHADPYDEALAIKYAELAGAAYCGEKVLEDWECGVKCISGVTDVKVVHGSSTKAFIAKWDGKCLLSLQGTTGLRASAVDLQTLPHAAFVCEGCTAHPGFLGEWRVMASGVIDALGDIGCTHEKPLHVTGHSMGAALSVIGALDLQRYHSWNIDQVYNFGMPRVGNVMLRHYFEEKFEGKFYRVTHGQDPFVDMPTGTGWYVHMEPEVFYKGDVKDGYAICTNENDHRCSSQYFPEAQYVMFSSSVAFHHKYMDIETTQAGCVSAHLDCESDISASWCTYGIPCNKDQRGQHVHCNHGPIWLAGKGKCHCDLGYCPFAGKCYETQEALRLQQKAMHPYVMENDIITIYS